MSYWDVTELVHSLDWIWFWFSLGIIWFFSEFEYSTEIITECLNSYEYFRIKTADKIKSVIRFSCVVAYLIFKKMFYRVSLIHVTTVSFYMIFFELNFLFPAFENTNENFFNWIFHQSNWLTCSRFYSIPFYTKASHDTNIKQKYVFPFGFLIYLFHWFYDESIAL